MLVLTRKLQQQIKIGDQITVTVLRVKGNTVRIGVAAPRDVRVIRGELPKGTANEQPAALDSTTLGESDGDEADQTAESAGAEVANYAAPAQPHATPRLPQLRKFDRHGAAPLKQLIAGSVLAK